MRWEYLHVHVQLNDIDANSSDPGSNESGWTAVLNARGAEGWELVQVWSGRSQWPQSHNLVFKRALAND